MTITTQATKPRYRTPSASVYCDISLDEFTEKQIIGYLRHLGHTVDGAGEDASISQPNPSDACIVSSLDLDRISTLALCGQAEPARKLALAIISEAIGREL